MRIPYGFVLISGGTLRVNEYEANIVSMIFEFYMAGASLGKVVDINRAIAQNPSIREIHYYCAPAKVSDPVEEFEVASRFSIKAPQKLMLESWNTIWNIFEQN